MDKITQSLAQCVHHLSIITPIKNDFICHGIRNLFLATRELKPIYVAFHVAIKVRKYILITIREKIIKHIWYLIFIINRTDLIDKH